MARPIILPAVLLATLVPAHVWALDWKPVNPVEMAQKTPKIDPGADAEVLFWDVHVEDRLDGGQDLSLRLTNYFRIKIFTAHGAEDNATVEIPRNGKRQIINVGGRTIKANGTIVELKKDSIFDRQLVKAKGAKMRGKTFVLPNVEAGDIIEYQYEEVRDDEIAQYLRLYFQRDLPVWTVTYYLKPLDTGWTPYTMRTTAFQLNNPEIKKERNGFYSITQSNLAAFRTEPNMPPEDQLQAWMLIYYEEDSKATPEKYWKELGKKDYERFKSLIKPDNQVKKTAEELTVGIADPEAKIAALEKYARTKIRNTRSRAFHLTAAERKALKDNRSPGDTLKQQAGTGTDVQYLFAAMAASLGFDSRIIRVPDRGDIFFRQDRPLTYFIDIYDVAVKIGDKWKVYDPSTPYLEPGMLRWQEEGVNGLLSDPKEGTFIHTAFSEPARSARRRKGQFKLMDDGTLEGDVEYTYTGHVAVGLKADWDSMTPAEQEKDWKDDETARLSTAEITGISIAGLADDGSPVSIKYHISVPGYASRAGRRLLLAPGFFQHNQSARFPETTRKFDVYFHYAWAEDDDVTIDLPDGWRPDEIKAPTSAKVDVVGMYSNGVTSAIDGKRLVYKRHLDWGQNENIHVRVVGYPQVRNIFNVIHDQDNSILSLREAK